MARQIICSIYDFFNLAFIRKINGDSTKKSTKNIFVLILVFNFYSVFILMRGVLDFLNIYEISGVPFILLFVFFTFLIRWLGLSYFNNNFDDIVKTNVPKVNTTKVVVMFLSLLLCSIGMPFFIALGLREILV